MHDEDIPLDGPPFNNGDPLLNGPPFNNGPPFKDGDPFQSPTWKRDDSKWWNGTRTVKGLLRKFLRKDSPEDFKVRFVECTEDAAMKATELFCNIRMFFMAYAMFVAENEVDEGEADIVPPYPDNFSADRDFFLIMAKFFVEPSRNVQEENKRPHAEKDLLEYFHSQVFDRVAPWSEHSTAANEILRGK